MTNVLISLQQTSLELTKDDRLLSLIPTNNQWSQEVQGRLNRRRFWLVATGSSITWVVIAFLFILIDSFVSLNNPNESLSEGHAVGTLWLWLLCLVVGWLWVPTFTCGEQKSANPRVMREAKQFEDVGAESIQEDTKPFGQEAGLKHSAPPDPTDYQSTASLRLPTGSQHNHGQPCISANSIASQSTVAVSMAYPAYSTTHHENGGFLIPKDDLGQLNRDERRLAATFNYSRVMRYLTLVDDIFRALDKPTREKDEVGPSRKHLILEAVSLIFSRRGIFLAILIYLLGTPCSLPERSRRCSKHRYSLSFSNGEQPSQP